MLNKHIIVIGREIRFIVYAGECERSIEGEKKCA
jgi:hypothetical protein